MIPSESLIVATFPPIWHDPFDPRSIIVQREREWATLAMRKLLPRGIINPLSNRRVSKMAESKSLMAFQRDVERMTLSKTGTEPPTSPVFPPCGTTAIPWALQCDRISETSEDAGHRHFALDISPSSQRCRHPECPHLAKGHCQLPRLPQIRRDRQRQSA